MEKTLFQNLIAICTLYKARMLLAFFLIFLANILLFTNPLLLRVAISEGNIHPPLWCLLFIAIAFVSSSLRYLMRVEFNKVSRLVERDVRSKLFAKIQEQSMEFYDRHGVGELIERLSNDMNAYRDVLGPGLIFPVYLVATIIPGLAALFMSPLLWPL